MRTIVLAIPSTSIPCHLSRSTQSEFATRARSAIRSARDMMELAEACAGDPNGRAWQVDVEVTADYEEGT